MRRMIGYVSLGASDHARAKRSHDAALGPRGIVNDDDNPAKRVLRHRRPGDRQELQVRWP